MSSIGRISGRHKYWTAEYHRRFARFADRVTFTWVNDLTFDEMLALAASLLPRSFILYGLLMMDAAGVTYNEGEALQRLHEVSAAPMTSLYRHHVGLGTVGGGRLLQAERMGAESARVAIRILHGEPATRFQDVFVATADPTYDWRELQRWKIREDRLPPGSVVLFRQPTVWQQYGWYVTTAAGLIGVQAALIVILLVQRRRRRETQAALQRAQATAQSQLNQIAHLDRVAAVGQLASSMAHELNQPLAGILANAQAAKRLLAEPQPDLDELRGCLADIVSDDKRASDVIRGMRHLLKKTDFGIVPLELNDLAANTIRLVENDALLNAVAIDFLPAPGLPVAYGDTVQIQQVILNLLTNGITAAANGGGVSTGTVTVWTSIASGPYVELGVRDSGKGISDSDLDRIFEPFFTTKPDGLGMGLTISRTIVEAHGGRLFVANDPDGGAIFRLHLPTAPSGTS